MKSESLGRLDADIAALLRAAEPYPDAPVDVQARVGKALAARIAGVLAEGSPRESESNQLEPGAALSTTPRAHGPLSLIAKPIRTIAATFLVGAAAGAGLHAAVQVPRERVVYVEKWAPALAASSAEPAGEAAPEGAVSPALEVPREMGPSVAPPAAAPPAKSTSARASDLGPEQALLDAARRALAEGRSADALGPLERHAQRYPKGILAEEREALAINVLVTLGRYDEARSRSDRFLRKYPGSLLRAAVEAAVRAMP